MDKLVYFCVCFGGKVERLKAWPGNWLALSVMSFSVGLVGRKVFEKILKKVVQKFGRYQKTPYL